MKIFLIIILGSFVSTYSFSQSTSDDQQKLRYLKEVEWPRAYREQDTLLLDRILADEFQMVDAQGVWSTKIEELDYIKGNKPSYSSFSFEIKRLEVFENNTAVVAGTGHIRGSGQEGNYYTVYQSSNILIKRKGMWKAIASHVSGVNTTYE